MMLILCGQSGSGKDAVSKVLMEKYPETVMVEYQDYIFIAFTKEGKERIRERIKPFFKKVLKEAEKLKKCMEELGEEECPK